MQTWFIEKHPRDKPKKKYMVLSPDNKAIYFGARGYSDYTIHKDKKRMMLYVNRHRKRENWKDPYTAGFWAKHLLWSKPSITAAKKYIKDNFKIKLIPLNRGYIPYSLTRKERGLQIKSILEKKDRPKVKSYKSIRSGWVKKFEKKYGKNITDEKWIDKNILAKEGQEQIINKGMAAFYSSGSRPNQNKFSWAYARLASVIIGGPARRVDNKIWLKYKR